jgi:hypothetical protein
MGRRAGRRPQFESLERKEAPAGIGFGPEFGQAVAFVAQIKDELGATGREFGAAVSFLTQLVHSDSAPGQP